MTKEQFVQACAELTRLGYHRNYGDNEYPRGDGRDYYYKTIERRMNRYEENRAVNQVLFRIWHFEEYKDRVPINSLYSLEL